MHSYHPVSNPRLRPARRKRRLHRSSSQRKKRVAYATLFNFIPLLFLLKDILTQSADGALEVLGQIPPRRAGGDLFSLTFHDVHVNLTLRIYKDLTFPERKVDSTIIHLAV